jgi:hypothetical protein
LGFFKKMNDKLGHWHIKQLIRDCGQRIMGRAMALKNINGGKANVSEAIDFLAKEGGYRIPSSNYDEDDIEFFEIENTQEKFSKFIQYYVVRNLDRPIDTQPDDLWVMQEEISRHWKIIVDNYNIE